ncbi:MAG TPA: hypothetical protein VG937_20410 [Polyangiaceae bacterium]|nr:hypothetical protein [Polyangiaceae bacterium]
MSEKRTSYDVRSRWRAPRYGLEAEVIRLEGVLRFEGAAEMDRWLFGLVGAEQRRSGMGAR